MLCSLLWYYTSSSDSIGVRVYFDVDIVPQTWYPYRSMYLEMQLDNVTSLRDFLARDRVCKVRQCGNQKQIIPTMWSKTCNDKKYVEVLLRESYVRALLS